MINQFYLKIGNTKIATNHKIILYLSYQNLSVYATFYPTDF